MADRNDPSQYLTDQTNDNDVTFYGDTAIDNTVIQEHVTGDYATPEQLTGYHNTGTEDDYLNQHAGRFIVRNAGSRAVAVPRNIPGMSGAVITAPALVAGWDVRETSGTVPAVIRFRDGLDAGNAPFLTLSVPAGGTAVAFPPLPIEATRAVFLEVVTGSVEGILYTVETRGV